MPLELVKSVHEMDRAELEALISVVQAKRMTAAVHYHAGVNAKLDHLATVARRKVESKRELLGKAIEGLDKALDRVTRYVDDLQILMHEYELAEDRKTAASLGEE